MTGDPGGTSGKFDKDLVPSDIALGPELIDMIGFFKARIPIRQVYETYVKKAKGIGHPVSGSRETYIRCPSPSHDDKVPSAWMNEEKGTWYCIVCDVGGDHLSLIAITQGYAVPGFQNDTASFREIIQSAVDTFGLKTTDAREAGFIEEASEPKSKPAKPPTGWPADWTPEQVTEAEVAFKRWRVSSDDATTRARVIRLANKAHAGGLSLTELMDPTEELATRGAEIVASEPEVTPEVEAAIARELVEHHVTDHLARDYAEAVDKGQIIELGIDPESSAVDWENIFPPENLITQVMQGLTVDDIPDEYRLWTFYTLVASLIGRRVEFKSSKGAISPSLWTVLSGSSGSGKSLSMDPLVQKLKVVAPASKTKDVGVTLIKRPASGEYFIASLRREIEDVDPITGLPVKMEIPNCSSLMQSDEFSTLLAVVNRPGSTLRPLMTEAYGCKRNQLIANTGAMSREANEVTGPALSILATVQPSRITNLMDQFDVWSGFVNRFTFVQGSPRRSVVLDVPIEPDFGTVQAVLTVIDEMLRCVGAFDKTGVAATPPRPWQLTFEEFATGTNIKGGGLEQWRKWAEKFKHEVELQERNDDDLAADMVRRVDLTLRKLMVIFAVVRMASGDLRRFIVQTDVEQALAHVDNMLKSLESIGIALVANSYADFEQWIIDKVREGNDIPKNTDPIKAWTPRDLHQRMTKSQKKQGLKFTPTLKALTDIGVIVTRTLPKDVPADERKTYLFYGA